MPRLIDKTPCEGLLPVTCGALLLSEMSGARITSVAPLNGQTAKLSAALKKLGLGWPAPNTAIIKGEAAIVWSGRDQALLIGADPEAIEALTATTDQSDGWARMRLEGPGAVDVLARLVALDLRNFDPGQVARSSLGHMAMVLSCPSAGVFDIMVFRSMAETAVTEIHHAMRSHIARAAL